MREDLAYLKVYIDILTKRKWMFLAMFLGCILVAAVIDFTTPKTYSANALLMVTPSMEQKALLTSKDIWDLGNRVFNERPMGKNAAMIAISTHKKLLKSTIVSQRIINKLGLKDKNGVALYPEDLSAKLSLEEEKGKEKETNIIKLQVIDSNPEIAKDLANAWAQVYVEYNTELILGEVKGTGEFVTDQFAIAKENLISAEGKVKDFNGKYVLDVMQSELSIKKSKLVEYEKEVIDSDIRLKTKKDTLEQLKKQLEGQEKFTVTSKAITDDALWQLTSDGKNAGGLDKKILKSETPNPIYQDLEKRIVNTNLEIDTLVPRIVYLNESVSLIKQEINILQGVILQANYELTQLNRQVSTYKKTYDILSDKMEEARLIKAAQLGEVKIVSPAVENKNPISSKRFVVFIGFITGLALVVLCTIFIAEFL